MTGRAPATSLIKGASISGRTARHAMSGPYGAAKASLIHLRPPRSLPRRIRWIEDIRYCYFGG